MKLLSTKFSIGDSVMISQLSVKGRVLALYITETGTQYSVRYFDNAKAEIVYFYENELSAMTY